MDPIGHRITQVFFCWGEGAQISSAGKYKWKYFPVRSESKVVSTLRKMDDEMVCLNERKMATNTPFPAILDFFLATMH